jgi:hypothetical protein
VIRREAAVEWVDKQDWSEQQTTMDDTDEIKLLNNILYHPVRLTPADERSIAEILDAIIKDSAGGMDPMERGVDMEIAALSRIGIRYDADSGLVYVSDSNPGMRRILDRTPWAKTYPRILKRIPGAETKVAIRFYGSRTRATGIPKALFVGE